MTKNIYNSLITEMEKRRGGAKGGKRRTKGSMLDAPDSKAQGFLGPLAR